MLATITEDNKSFTDILVGHEDYAVRTPIQQVFYDEAVRLATELNCTIDDIQDAFETFYAELRDRFRTR